MKNYKNESIQHKEGLLTEIIRKYYNKLGEKHNLNFTSLEISRALDNAAATMSDEEFDLSDEDFIKLYKNWFDDAESTIINAKLEQE